MAPTKNPESAGAGGPGAPTGPSPCCPRHPQSPYLTMAQAGAWMGRTANWTKRLLTQTPGAPALVGIPAPGSTREDGPRTWLVRADEFEEFLETYRYCRDRRDRAARDPELGAPGVVTHPDPGILPTSSVPRNPSRHSPK